MIETLRGMLTELPYLWRALVVVSVLVGFFVFVITFASFMDNPERRKRWKEWADK